MIRRDCDITGLCWTSEGASGAEISVSSMRMMMRVSLFLFSWSPAFCRMRVTTTEQDKIENTASL